MPNIKKQKKRVITNAKRTERNKATKSAVKNALKVVYDAVENEDKEVATAALHRAYSLLDLSIAKNLHHKNYVSRQKSRLSRAVNSLK